MKVAIVFIFASLALGAWSQVIDDFEDGDLSKNPEWTGDITEWGKGANGELQLQSVKENSPVYIVTAASWQDTCAWEIYIKGDAKLSASVNFIRIYLSTDTDDLTGAFNGYFIKIGENGDEDKLLFYRQRGSTTTKLGEGSDATMGSPLGNNDMRLKVTRSTKGEWVFNTDTTGGSDFKEEFRVTDNNFSSGDYFGLNVNFSSANIDKFYFDDLKIGPIFSDEDAPVLDQLTVVDNRNLLLTFDEPLNKALAELVGTYRIDGAQVVKAKLSESDPSIVNIEAPVIFNDGLSYTLSIDGLEDLYGNSLDGFTRNFSYILPAPPNIIISEIFADPTPAVGLPEAEFVELYNAGSQTVDLGGTFFSDASKEITLPPYELEAGAYVILCTASAQSQYDAFGNTLAASLPALNNASDVLTLRSRTRQLLYQVAYTDDWYADSDKKAGGYSLELNNPILKCTGSNNWKASINASGGTPGTVNSVWNLTPDTEAPEAVLFSTPYDDTVVINFNEPIDSASVFIAEFELKGVGKADFVRVSNYPHQQVTLGFSSKLVENQTYAILINGVEDCEGNVLNKEYGGEVTWVVPKQAQAYDVLIHEIFADPEPVIGLPSSEYIELFNRAEYPIEMKGWTFSDSRTTATIPDYVIAPKSYVILCKDGDETYWEEYGPVLGVESFPGLNNSGEVLILRSADTDIHIVEFSDEWYDDETKKDGGYSLEMIDAENPCGRNGNWTGAAIDIHGTPAAANSKAGTRQDNEEPSVLQAVITDSSTVVLLINETIAINANVEFKLSDGGFTLLEPWSVNALRDNYELTWAQEFEANKEYELEVSGLADCVGNKSEVQVLELILPEKSDSFEVVVNEVLFNPPTGGKDYIELYNRSNAYFNLGDFLIANRDESGELGSIYEVTTPFLLRPHSFALLTTSKDDLLSRYMVKDPLNVVEMPTLPSMPDGEGEVVLMDKDSHIIDELWYDADWHYALLDDAEGYSLERINYDSETQAQINWHSASTSSGGGTPTYVNSQYSEIAPTANTIELSGRSFSPDNDGFEDYLGIRITSEAFNQSITIKIFNLDGQMVKDLVPHDVLGANSTYRWDGFDDMGKKAPVGVYILLFEIVNMDEGTSERFKESVVLTSHL